jgi:hypothetical protein
MATVQEIYNEIDRIDNAKSGIAGAIEEKGVEVPAGAKIDEYPELVRQIQQGDTSDCVKFTPQTLTEEQKAQARENIGARSGKMGVISQTQTWSGSDSSGYDYAMSGLVMGVIPQLFIDLVGDYGVVFNEQTGYFELNGLVDVSYQEMRAIYKHGDIRIVDHIPGALGNQSGTVTEPARLRTLLCSTTDYFGATWAVSVNFGVNMFKYIEVIYSPYFSVIQNRQLSWAGNAYENISSTYLKRIENISFSNVSGAKVFNCPNLRVCKLYNLRANLTLAQSSLLEASSIATMITYAGTQTITITLHPTAYARAIADADVQAALATKTNVTLASA